MENQHRKIEGYRELNAEEIARMNAVKLKGKELLDLVRNEVQTQDETDKRWCAIGITHIEQGIMAVIRSITKPEI